MRIFLSLSIAFAITAGCRADPPADLFLGNPSQAGAADRHNFLVTKPEYVLSYNDAAGEPNWVSWGLVKSDVGEAARKNEFSEDVTLPKGFKQITGKDYTDCGFDRGHMCPHSDRAANRTESYATFVMTNVVPQSAALNRNAWNQEEIYLRTLATNGQRLYIIAGPTGSGGVGAHGPATTIAGGRVAVPAACWKIAVIVSDEGRDDPSEITADTRVIAVLMPNDASLGFDWGKYRTSVAAIEKLTGFKFFTALPPAVAGALERKVDGEKLPPPVEPEWHKRLASTPKKGSDVQ